MKRAVLVSALALSCATSAEVRDGREIGGVPDPDPAGQTGQVRDSAVSVPADSSQAPRRFIHTVMPRMLNVNEVNRALQREYPEHLKRAGIGGITVVRFFVNVEGRVENQIVEKSSGNAALDRAALKVGEVARFTPARNGHQRVALWIEVTFTFSAR